MKVKKCYELVCIGQDVLMIPVGDEIQRGRILFSMNEETMWLIQELQKNDLSVDELAIRLQLEYDVDSETAKQDILKLLQRLDQMNLMAG